MGKIIELRLVEQVEELKGEHPSYNNFGLSDLDLGTNFQILKKDGINTRIALLSHLIIPSGADGLSGGRIGSDNTVAVSHHLNKFIDISYNLGYDFTGYGKGDLTYSISLGAEITETVDIFVEPYGEITALKEQVLNFDTGVSYLVKDNLQLDLSYGTGLNQKMNYFSIGCSWNIKLNKTIVKE